LNPLLDDPNERSILLNVEAEVNKKTADFAPAVSVQVG
jgi:hypothetical protein